MKTKCARKVWLTLMVLPILFLSARVASAMEDASRNALTEGHILYLPIPADVSREAIPNADDALKTRLCRLAVQSMLCQDCSKGRGIDLVVVFLDHEGAPILPDLEEARQHRAASREESPPSAHQLTFTFHSQDYPWDGKELGMLHKATEVFYPVIREVYGDPAFAITVNVRKDPTIPFQGAYFASTNEILLTSPPSLDVFCHEIIHAFRDDDMIRLGTFEEGMTVAAEVEVFNRLRTYTFWDEHHMYAYDVFYEGLNDAAIGSSQGLFDYTSPLLLLRYQLAGYAWGKVLIEDPLFFSAFNRQLYSRALFDPDLLTTESALMEIASALLYSVEGKPFALWYAQQGIFDSAPAAGSFLYQNSSNFVTYLFDRDSSGAEQMKQNAMINWAVYDYRDVPLDMGCALTCDFGWISFAPQVPDDYRGRIKMVAYSPAPQGEISSVALRPFGYEEGIFGILPVDDWGIIEIVSLDAPAYSARAEVVNGAFSVPSLTSLRGRFVAVFAGTGGTAFSRQFNKDASSYFLLMAERETTADLSVAQSVSSASVAVGENIFFAVAVTNGGPEQSTDVVLQDTLPEGAVLVSATSSQGNCVEHDGELTCALNSLTGGSTASVMIEVKPCLEGNITNTAEITHSGLDPNMSNNAVSSHVTALNSGMAALTDKMCRKRE